MLIISTEPLSDNKLIVLISLIVPVYYVFLISPNTINFIYSISFYVSLNENTFSIFSVGRFLCMCVNGNEAVFK